MLAAVELRRDCRENHCEPRVGGNIEANQVEELRAGQLRENLGRVSDARLRVSSFLIAERRLFR